MGQVYEATHAITGERVAIKRMLPGLTNDQAVLRRFLEEARTMTLLKHQSIVQLKQFFEVQGRFFLIMDFIEGQSAEQIAESFQGEGKPIPIDQVLQIAIPITAALDYIHDLRATQTFMGDQGHEVTREIEGVVHRDIKPANILVNPEGEPFLMDFGIAKPEGRERMTRIGGVVGTYEFMAPEQIRGGDIGPYTDQYSLAVTIFHLLAGTPPYPQRTEAGFDAMEGHLKGEIPSIGQFRKDVSPALEKAIQRAMAKNPEGRFANCQEFGRALANSHHSPPATTAIESFHDAPPATNDTDSIARINRPPRTAIAVGVALLAIAIAVTVAWRLGNLPKKDIQGTQTEIGQVSSDEPATEMAETESRTEVEVAQYDPPPTEDPSEAIPQQPAHESVVETKPTAEIVKANQAAIEAAQREEQKRAEVLREFQDLIATAERQERNSDLTGARASFARAESLSGIDTSAATRNRTRIDALIAANENAKVDWYCLCYKERIGGIPTLSTACRRTMRACNKLAQTANRGRKPFVKNSVSRWCSNVRAEYPWDSLGSQSAWKPSKRPGSWWSDRGCFLP